MENTVSSNVLEIQSFDGYNLQVRLTTPKYEKEIKKLVIFVNGSGPNTYDNKRKVEDVEFNYFDFFADAFSDNGIAFLSSSTRGVSQGNEAPFYAEISDEEYQKYTPANSVEDLLYIIEYIRSDSRFEKCEIYLLGWSEGTILAPLFAQKYPDRVSGLLLAGYVNINLKEILEWQNNGGASMVWYRRYFDRDGDGRVSKEEYTADPDGMVSKVLQNIDFEQIDINADGFIDEKDMDLLLTEHRESIFAAIDRNDDIWLKENYPVPLTSKWFKEHFELKANMEVLPTLELPIHIFHGDIDQSCNVKGAYDVREKFHELKKTNLSVHIFKDHNHDLNYMDIVTKNKIPDGIQAILDVVIG